MPHIYSYNSRDVNILVLLKTRKLNLKINISQFRLILLITYCEVVLIF